MASLFSVLAIARDGMMAQTGALDVTGQNVAGANTPGYVKRTAQLTSRPNGGVEMTGVARSFDSFTYTQLVTQEAHLASASARSNALADVEAIVSPATDTLSDRIDALSDAFHELSTHPSDTGVRSTVLASAQALSRGFAETADGLNASRAELFSQAKSVADDVNTKLDQLAKLDKSVTEAVARGQDASGLRDQRDQIAREIGQSVGARIVPNDNGSVTLFAAGTVLYEGGTTAKLEVSLDSGGMLRVQANRAGNVVDVTSGLDTGKLAGIREARDKDIPEVLSQLDAFATEVADAFNTVHASGFGLDGNDGRPLFSITSGAGAAHSMSLDPGMEGHPEYLATAASAGDVPGGNEVAVALSRVSQSVLPGGGTMSERYAGIASKVGLLHSTAEGEAKMREDTVATASALRESVSGVSTDEEMINMQQFQRAFEASTRVLRVVDELFDTLMQAF